MDLPSKRLDWYLAQYKPNSSKIAEKNLERQGFPTFLPMEKTTRRKGAKFVDVNSPLFPGYIFVAVDSSTGPWSKINSTLGITRLVCLGPHPSKVPTALVDQLLARFYAADDRSQASDLSVGDSVAFQSGPFTSFVGSIESIAAEKRIWVLMELMGAKIKVAISTEHVRAFQAQSNQLNTDHS